jgi:hypothetical protein
MIKCQLLIIEKVMKSLRLTDFLIILGEVFSPLTKQSHPTSHITHLLYLPITANLIATKQPHILLKVCILKVNLVDKFSDIVEEVAFVSLLGVYSTC